MCASRAIEMPLDRHDGLSSWRRKLWSRGRPGAKRRSQTFCCDGQRGARWRNRERRYHHQDSDDQDDRRLGTEGSVPDATKWPV